MSDKDKTHGFRFHIGMRTIKTVLAVFICAMIDYFRGQHPFYSMLAAVISIQRDIEQTLTTGLQRLISTILGGLTGLLFLLAIGYTPIESYTPVYYLLLSLMLIPVITITITLKRPDCAYLSCVVFISITAAHAGADSDAVAFALTRTFDTLLGVIVGFIVNLIPSHKKDTPQTPPKDAEGEEDSRELSMEIDLEEPEKPDSELETAGSGRFNKEN